MLEDVNSYRHVLPRTQSARRVGTTPHGDALVEVTQGTSLVSATYTMRLRHEESVDGGALNVRFWLDPSRPHGIDDAWGFFRAQPLADGRTMLTFGVLVDMGDGLARDLFEERVRDLALGVPQLVKSYVARLHAEAAKR
jgi:hypothetical protein